MSSCSPTTLSSRRRARSRPSAWLMTILVSHVDSRASPRKLPRLRYAGEVGLLQRVLGVGVVAQDRSRGAKERAVVAAHDDLERRSVAADDAGDERVVVFARGVPGSLGGSHWRLDAGRRVAVPGGRADRPPVRSGDEQDRPVRPGEDAARDRAEDEAAERGMAVRAHDDEVERLALGEPGDLLRGVARTVESRQVPAALPGDRDDRIEHLRRLVAVVAVERLALDVSRRMRRDRVTTVSAVYSCDGPSSSSCAAR
jgi:hypothetical protein